MKSDDLSMPAGDGREQHYRKPYLRPGTQRISPQKARELLLRNADPSDAMVRQMLERIEKILRKGAFQ